jgi:DNA polymerase III alpha subunit (gram-positive type)
MVRRPAASDDMAMDGKIDGICPVCQQGDLISISMNVSGTDLSFTTCHMCEAKWWYRDGDPIPLQGVIGTVLDQRG